MVFKVKRKTMTRRRSFPTVSQDSDTPYQFTAKMLRRLSKREYVRIAVPVKVLPRCQDLHVNSSQDANDGDDGNVISPET